MSFGSMSGANSSLKGNRALNKKHRKGFKDRVEDLSRKPKEALEFKKVSDKELAIIKEKIRKKAKRERLITNLVVIILAPIIIYLLYHFWFV